MKGPLGPFRGAARAGTIGLALALCGQGASAGEAQDLLFGLQALRALEAGQTLVYDFSREGSYPADKLGKVADGEARLTVLAPTGGAGPTAVASLTDGGEPMAKFDPFPADAGNPLFMVFMEEAVTSMSKLTGGSVFYIRNRMREALGAQNVVKETSVAYAGHDVSAREITFHPFLNDRNAGKMGAPFVDLTITFVMSDDIPGEFARMEAVTGPGEGGAPLLNLRLNLSKVEES